MENCRKNILGRRGFLKNAAIGAAAVPAFGYSKGGGKPPRRRAK